MGQQYWALVAALIGAGSLAGAPGGLAAQAPDAPRVTLQSVRPVRSLRDWPGLSLTVDRDAYVVVVAATRGRRESPLQLLSPASPRDEGRVRAGRRVPIRSVGNAEMLHLVNWGESPLVVAFASTAKPNLAPFATGRGWSGSLVLDTLLRDEQAFVDLLGSTIFGPTATFDALLAPASVASPLSTYADIWSFDDECVGWSGRWTRGTGLAGYGLYAWDPIDPIARGVGLMLPMGAGYGWMGLGWTPIVVGGQRRAIEPSPYGSRGWPCTGFRVAWWPNYVAPDAWPVDTARRATDLVAAPGSPLPYLPRYPLPGQGLDLASAGASGSTGTLTTTGTEPVTQSPWRRGLTDSERRYPGVSAEPRWKDGGKYGTVDDLRDAVAERGNAARPVPRDGHEGRPLTSTGGYPGAPVERVNGGGDAGTIPAPTVRREPDPAPRTTGAEDPKPQAPVKRDPPPP